MESLLQFSEPRRFNVHAKVVTGCYTIQNVEWSDALVDTNDGLQWVYSITYKTNECTEETLYPTIFDVWYSVLSLPQIERLTDLIVKFNLKLN